MSSVVFQSALNKARYFSLYEKGKREDGVAGFTPSELEQGALEICKGLQSTYRGPGGKKLQVSGDISKVRYVAGLSKAALRLLNHARTIGDKIPGADDVRKYMRFDTQAYRIRYGVPIFVTISPDDKCNLLVLRMSRTRISDPIVKLDEACKKLGTIDEPQWNPEEIAIAIDNKIYNGIANLQTRRAAIARDATASVDSFRTQMLLLMEHLFGVRCCPKCPDCNFGQGKRHAPCQDFEGSNATPVGGIFGRVDAIYGSIEAQKSAGALHLHMQVFVQ